MDFYYLKNAAGKFIVFENDPRINGKKWRGGLFGGYLKNLGATEKVSGLIGTGLNLDQLATATAEVSYNLPNWKFGLEYSYCNAWYGSNDEKGKVVDTHRVDNHRIVAVALFQF